MQQEPTALRMPDPGIRELFSEAQRFQSWLDVEAALAQAQAELDVIPSDAAEEITRKARLELLDMDSIYEGLARTGHGLVPLIWELDRVCDGDAGGLVHWGATTQNITQTGKLLQLRKAHRIYLDQLARILEMLADLAERTRDFVLPGRTHGQHAVPATFGLKVAVWIDELIRHVERLRGCEDRVFVAMLGGGAGTLGSLGEIGMDIQERMAEKLDMHPMSMPSRTTADHLCEYVVLLGMLSATCSKIGREVYTLMKQEFGELEEPVPPGTVGSSTMPQKRNPKVSQDIVAGAAQVRALVPLALEAMMTEHEADRTTSVMMDRALTQAAITPKK
jgi:3-carboxy-cis,cis-muconate cycloisomerase